MRRLSRAILGGAIALTGGAFGCAEERAPINRTQPNALDKTFLVGKDLASSEDDPSFYTQGTVVDVGYGAAQDGLFTSTYAQPVSIIKWQITEDLLLGRIVYERIPGSDGKGAEGAKDNEGQLAYVYPIQSHFDVRRDYNPSTGEEGNTIVENTSDRPWNERQFIRVDWSRNLNTDAYDYDTLSLIGIYGGVSYEPLAYYVTDPADPDAPHFDVEDGYFDVTNKAFATPGIIDLSHLGWGVNEFPACFLPNELFGGSWPAGNCNPVEVTIRQSFRRVEVTDYQPKDWDGRQFQAFGVFYNDRFGYARNYGIVDEQWHRFANLYEIWDKSHAYKDVKEDGKCPGGTVSSEDFPGQCEYACYTPETTPFGSDPLRDEDGNGTHDECESAGKGSQCDKFTHKCTLPYAERTQKTITWHYSKGSNPEYYEGTEWATHEWDVAMRGAVQASKYAECVRVTPGDKGSVGDITAACQKKFPMYTGQQEENEDAVNLAREVDLCRNSGKSQEDCEKVADKIAGDRNYSPGVVAIAKMPEMIVLCHGPVEAGDPAACAAEFKNPTIYVNGEKITRQVLPEGFSSFDCTREWAKSDGEGDQEILDVCKTGFVVRQGDLRYHQVNVLQAPQSPSSWGIMTDSVDPVTGRKIAASINVWSHVTDLASQELIDTTRYIKGEFTAEDVTEATFIDNYAALAEAGRHNGSLGKMSAENVRKRVIQATDGRSLQNGTAKLDVNADLSAIPQEVLQKAAELKRELSQVKADPYAVPTSRAFTDARRLSAQNSPTEASLVTQSMMEFGGINRSQASKLSQGASNGIPVSGAALQGGSILRGANPQIDRDLFQARELGLAARGACILADAPQPNGLTGIADVLERKFGKFNAEDDLGTQNERAVKMHKWLKSRYHHAVIVHEMGHSIGERHNFVSSAYAYGYRPQYWQLRTKDGTVTEECTDVSADGEGCVGPRYFDPITDNERDQLLHMFMQSSVMDYPGELSQDMVGLGAYDFAAARFFYGDVMSVFTDPDYAAKKPKSKAVMNLTDNFGGIIGYQYSSNGTDTIHYSQLQSKLGLISDCATVANNDEEARAKYQPSDWSEERNGIWDPLVDGLLVKTNGKYTRCKSPQVDYMAADQMREPKSSELGGFFDGGKAIDRFDRTRVPYGFATDSWADTGNLSVFRHDNGADPYELFEFFITEQESRHIFSSYRRGRTSFSLRGAANRTRDRYNSKMRDAAKGLGLLANIYKDFALEVGQDFDKGYWAGVALINYRENILASGIAFDHFSRQLFRPEAGEHYRDGQVYLSNNDALAGGNTITMNVPNGAVGRFNTVSPGGQLIENALGDGNGEYDRDYNINAGSYYQKVYVPFMMTESVDNFISDSRRDFVDGRYRAVSIADLFPDGYRRMFANSLTNDMGTNGVRIAATAAGAADVESGTRFPKLGFGWTTWWTPTPEVCFPGENGTFCTTYGCPEGTTCTVDNNLVPTGVKPLDAEAPANTTLVDPQVNWEIQKFMVAQSLLYLPENQKTNWINMIGIWEAGADSDPEFTNRIELRLPDGKVYIAKTYGTEVIFGKTVQRGIGARVLEYANELLQASYVTTPVLGADGVTVIAHAVTLNPATGLPLVKFDGLGQIIPDATCSATDNTGCTCSANRACRALEAYQSMPAYIRQSMHDFRMAEPTMRGLYD